MRVVAAASWDRLLIATSSSNIAPAGMQATKTVFGAAGAPASGAKEASPEARSRGAVSAAPPPASHSQVRTSPAQLLSSPCSRALSLNQLEITKDIKPEPRFRPSPFCANPHETCAFCTCPQKNRVFPCIFAVSPLRSFSAFAIVPNGPSLRRKIGGRASLGADLDSFGVDRHLRRISRLNGS